MKKRYSISRMLKTIVFISIFITIPSALFILVDVIYHPQKMKVMNVVWPVTALYSGPLGIWIYYKLGRNKDIHIPFWQSVLKGALRCGCGCTLGGILAAIVLLFVPVAV
jgi:hypothetical protein